MSGTSSLVRAATQRLRALHLALGAVAVAAGVEGEAEIVSAADAAVAMAAERRRAAALDSADDLVLRPGRCVAAALDEASGPDAEDVGHLQGGAAHEPTRSREYPEGSERPAVAGSRRPAPIMVSRTSAWPSRISMVGSSAPLSSR